MITELTNYHRRCKDKEGETFAIRTVQPGDSELLYDFFSSLSSDVRALFRPHPFDLEFAKKATTRIRPHKRVRIVASTSHKGREKIVGYAFLAFSPLLRRIAVFGVAILKPFIGRGVGSALLDCSLALAARMGAREVWLTVFEDNLRAIALYDRFGFNREQPPLSLSLLALRMREGIHNYGFIGAARKYIEMIRSRGKVLDKAIWMVRRV